jgi:hypothetical protein
MKPEGAVERQQRTEGSGGGGRFCCILESVALMGETALVWRLVERLVPRLRDTLIELFGDEAGAEAGFAGLCTTKLLQTLFVDQVSRPWPPAPSPLVPPVRPPPPPLPSPSTPSSPPLPPLTHGADQLPAAATIAIWDRLLQPPPAPLQPLHRGYLLVCPAALRDPP